MSTKSYSLFRIEKDIHKILLRTLTEEINDPLLKNATFTFVKLSRDKSWLTVFVDHYDRNLMDYVIKALQHSVGVFKHQLATHLTIYKIPQIKFVNDQVIDKAARIEQLIAQNLKKE